MPSKVANMIQRISDFDHRAAVYGAAACARTALEVVPAGEDGPRERIEAVEAWVRGEIDDETCLATIPSGTHYGVAAISSLVHATVQAPFHRDPGALARVPDSAAHTRAAVAVKSRLKSPEFKPLRKRALDEMLEIVRALPWPATSPSEDQLAKASAPLRGAWDLVADREVELTLAELEAASKRAERLGLDMHDPVARAVAERATSALTRKLRAVLGQS